MGLPTSGQGILAGRNEEVTALHERLGAARSGRTQVVVVEGPAGIGKTALLTEFLEHRAAPAQVLWLRCDRFEQDVSFSAAELLLDESVDPTCSELEVGRRLLTRLGDARPAQDVTVLAVDDAHWMDGPSARALRFALRRLRVEPLLVLISRRPGSPDTDLFATEEPQATTVLRPGPLDRACVLGLADGIRDWRLSENTADRILEQTGGSPLLISSVLHNAADPRQLETWTNVPASAATAAARMLGSLDAESRRLVETAAVLAEPADLVTLGGIAEIGDAAPRLTAASAAGLLSVDSSGAIAPAHALLRDAVYDSLPLHRRQILHARAADWTSGDRRLGHRAAAVSRPDPVLVADLITAADAARSSRRYDLAATHRLRARSISGDTVQRDALLCEALLDRVSAENLDGADELAAQAAALSPNPLRSLALGLLARERGRVGEAKTYLQQALRWTPAPADESIRQRAALAAGMLHLMLNEGGPALAALDTVEHYEDPVRAGDATVLRSMGLFQTRDARAALAHLEDVSLSPEGSAWESEVLSMRGMAHLYVGETAEAIADLDRSIAMSHLWRPSTNQPRIFAYRSVARYHHGDWDGALADAAAARALAPQAEVWSVVWAEAISIDVPANRGQWDVAAEHLAEARAALGRLPYALVVDLVVQHESALHLARGDHGAVLELVEPLLAESHLKQLAHFRTYRWSLPAWISSCVELGRMRDAEQGLDRYAAMVRQWPEGVEPDLLGWLRGLLAQARGEPEAAREHFRANLAEPQTQANPFVQAQVCQALGRLEQATGRRREALRQLTTAHDLFARLRATPWLERCRLDLAASGLRSTGTDMRTLTEREENVAALVSRGYTNKEVARELFVSAKAVEYHLRKIYTKLGVSSRQELRRSRTPAAAPLHQAEVGVLR